MTHDDIGLDLAHIAQSGPTPVSLSDQLREMQEYTPEPTGLFALIARSVLGLEDVVSLILLESEWRSAANSPEARTYAQLLAQLAEQQGTLEQVRGLVDAALQDAEQLSLDVSLSGADALDSLQTTLIQIRAGLAPHSVEISRVPAETTAEAAAQQPFNSVAVWRLLDSEGLDLITVNAARRGSNLPATLDESQMLLTAVAIVLGRLNTERQVVGYLAERHDALRLKYAQLEGDLYHTKNKLAHAAKKHGSEALKSLVVQLPAQSRTDVLKSLPTGAAIAQEGREGVAQ